VVTDSRSPRDGRFIEKIGTYDPKTDPSKVVVDKDRAAEWIKKGAIPSNTVKKLLKIVDLKV
jgi:small subunit ribosomal protein S16